MKVKSFVTALLLVFTMFSCSKYDDSEIWDYVKGMNTRLTALEEKCKDMNTNITSLQTIVAAFENGDYITNVAPVMRNGVQIGYTISFLKSPAITIYNGADGKDGNDGYTPVIGVKQDTDELYYWTIDGEWLLDDDGMKVRASSIDGKDGLNGTNGTNGTNGINGSNGADGITPLLKIEDEYWYVSYDDGTSWQILGKATGDKGADGTSLFSSVEIGATEVTFVLTDGTIFIIPLQSSIPVVEDEHDAVDLGLPSGTLWATCNVGADSPEEYGDYFAWAETTGYLAGKRNYDWSTYKYCMGTNQTLTKYCTRSDYGYNGFTDNLTELTQGDDAATVNWGINWQMPSEEQLLELVNSEYTTTSQTGLNGKDGLKITSKSNGNSIFLPAAGAFNGVSYGGAGHGATYWSRSLAEFSSSARCLIVDGNVGGTGRCYGGSVRPVRKQ